MRKFFWQILQGWLGGGRAGGGVGFFGVFFVSFFRGVIFRGFVWGGGLGLEGQLWDSRRDWRVKVSGQVGQLYGSGSMLWCCEIWEVVRFSGCIG